MLQEAGVDICDVSAGQTSILAKPVYGRMFQTPFSDRIRNETGMATMAVGNIYEPDHVNSILMAGRADLVCLARPHLADPYWTLHAAVALGDRGVKWPDPYLPGRDQLYRLAERNATMGAESMIVGPPRAGDRRRLGRRQGDRAGAGRRRRRRHHLRAARGSACRRWPAKASRIFAHRRRRHRRSVDGGALREGRSSARTVRHRRGQCRHGRQRAGAPDHARRLAAHARRQPDRRVPDREAGAGRHGRARQADASSSSPRPPASRATPMSRPMSRPSTAWSG